METGLVNPLLTLGVNPLTTLQIGPISLIANQVYWKFDAASGGNYVDSIRGVLLIPTAGGVSSISGIISNGVQPPATGTLFSTPGLITGSSATLAHTSGKDYSLSCWVNVSNFGTISGTSSFVQIVSSGVEIIINQGSTGFFAKCGGTFNSGGAIVLSTSTWHLVVIAFNSLASSAKVYLDNSLITSISCTIGSFGSDIVAVKTSVGGPVTTGGPLVSYDELGIWMEHELSTSEISSMWNSGSGARPPGV